METLIKKIQNIENYVVLTYPQFKANIEGNFCRVYGVYYNGDNLQDIECINEETDENIFDKLHRNTQNEIEKILLDILDDENNLTY